MAMIGYVARVLTGVRFKKMNHMIDVVHQKCGQNKVRTFFDMLWCAVRYGAGYYDYTMFGFYDMTGTAGHLSHPGPQQEGQQHHERHGPRR